MYRVWYWAMIDPESDGRFIASIPDLGTRPAYGDTDKDAVAHVTELAGEHVRAAVDDGQPVPQRRHFSEMPSHIRSKEVGRTIIPVEVDRRAAANSALSHARLSLFCPMGLLALSVRPIGGALN
jgi:predicted RNase H-like HicB family nuclease